MSNKTKVKDQEQEVKETVDETVENTTETVETEVTDETDETKEQTETATDDSEGSEEVKKDKKDLLIEELNDKYMRTFAEFDNFRKRTEKEKAAMFEVGAKNIIEKILPIVDNFERGLAVVPEENKEDPFVTGMDKIYKQLITSLEEVGVKPIEALNAEFNPDFHNAVMHIEDENFGGNIIVEEFQKGYMYRDSVVRHSMVKVAN